MDAKREKQIEKDAELFVKSIIYDAMKTERKLDIKTKTMEYTQIKETPFVLVEDLENEVCFGAVGQYRVTALESLNEENKQKITEALEKPTWNNIIPVIEVLINKILTNKNSKNGRNTKNH